jgi:hypothetical protein
MPEIFTISTRESRLGPSFKVPRCRTTRFGEHSLRFQGPRLWNHLPKETKMSKTIVELKNKLKNYSNVKVAAQHDVGSSLELLIFTTFLGGLSTWIVTKCMDITYEYTKNMCGLLWYVRI